MAHSIHISTARAMLNSGDPVDISSAEPKRFAFRKTMTVWLSAFGHFRSAAEKETLAFVRSWLTQGSPCFAVKHFGFAVSVLILNEDGTKIVRLLRKEACYCRFAPAEKQGRIPKILYANWQKAVSDRSQIEEIDLLDIAAPWRDLQDKLAKKTRVRKFAIVSRIPTVDSIYRGGGC